MNIPQVLEETSNPKILKKLHNALHKSTSTKLTTTIETVVEAELEIMEGEGVSGEDMGFGEDSGEDHIDHSKITIKETDSMATAYSVTKMATPYQPALTTPSQDKTTETEDKQRTNTTKAQQHQHTNHLPSCSNSRASKPLAPWNT